MKNKKKKRVIEYTHWEFDRDEETVLLFNGNDKVNEFSVGLLMEIALEKYVWGPWEYKKVDAVDEKN